MNSRALVTLGLLLGAAHGKSPDTWLSELHQKLRDLQAKEPATTLAKVVLFGAAAFYAAEHGKNPKITSYYDALVYVSTNLSVGYSDILARTPLGKSLGSLLMTYGPALAARGLDAPADSVEPPATDAGLGVVAGKLELILAELVRQRASTPARDGMK
jgi:hypothetical protein